MNLHSHTLKNDFKHSHTFKIRFIIIIFNFVFVVNMFRPRIAAFQMQRQPSTCQKTFSILKCLSSDTYSCSIFLNMVFKFMRLCMYEESIANKNMSLLCIYIYIYIYIYIIYIYIYIFKIIYLIYLNQCLI